LLKDKKTLAYFQDRYRYLLVDEYQDTNRPQCEIVRLIGKKHRNVCVVGDDDQSIYGWRGADVSKILNFEKDFPNTTVVRLETNYRSTDEILRGANLVIRNNVSRHKKTLRSAVGSGDAITVLTLDDEQGESAFVVDDILRRMREGRVSFSNFAILFRTQIQPRVFEMQLRQKRVPYYLVGGMSFFDRKEVRDIMAYLKLIANAVDELALLRVINTPPRGIGLTTIEKAMALAAKHKLPLAEIFLRGGKFPELPKSAVSAAINFLNLLGSLRNFAESSQLVELVKRLVIKVRYDEEIKRCYPDSGMRTVRWDAINEIMNMAEIHMRERKKADLASFLEDLALSASEGENDGDDASDKVTLMTLHSAKGLEFDQVYLVGMEEGLLPHLKSVQDGTIEEERRLAYVGITRAKKRLTLTFTRSRARYGQRLLVTPSRFLYELRGKQPPEELIEGAHKQKQHSTRSNKKAAVSKKRSAKRV
ncbi:MAG: UvrD-helicase domain-containing protein, partial [Lentisphaerae bacterium]|nr:UvrD-helicase domain-containing protein [Lentisphaerota bacterium]